MINTIWALMILVSIITVLINPNASIETVTRAALHAAEQAVTVSFGLLGILAFWSGIMRIAEEAGVTDFISRLLAPVVRRLFPSVPQDHPAAAAIVMALTANMLGLGNAATPLGLKAMHELRTLSPDTDVASDAMCTFLALSTAGVTIIPSTVIAIRMAQGSADPASIVGPTLLATACGTMAAIVFDKVLRPRERR